MSDKETTSTHLPSPSALEQEVRDAITTLNGAGFPGGFDEENNPTFEAAVARIMGAMRLEKCCSCFQMRIVPRRAGAPSEEANAASERDTARRAVRMFASVIKCGESWTEECQQEFDAAMGRTAPTGHRNDV